MTGNPGNYGNLPAATRTKTAYSGFSFRYRSWENCIAVPELAVWFPEFPGFPPPLRSASLLASHGAGVHAAVARSVLGLARTLCIATARPGNNRAVPYSLLDRRRCYDRHGTK